MTAMLAWFANQMTNADCSVSSAGAPWLFRSLRNGSALAGGEADSAAGHLAQLFIIGSSFSYGEVPASAMGPLYSRKDRGTLQSAPWLTR